jgi:hypothetical protein
MSKKRKPLKEDVGGSEDRIKIRRFAQELTFRKLIGSLACEEILLKVEEARAAFQTLSDKAPRAAVNQAKLDGYKLAMLVPVQSLMETAVESPEVVGLKETDGVYMMYNWNEEGSPIPTGATPHEGFVRSMWWVRTKIMSARNWDELIPAAAEVSRYLHALFQAIGTHYKIRVHQPAEVIEVSQMAPRFALDFLHMTFHDIRFAQFAHWELFRGGSTSDRQARARRARQREDLDKELEAAFFEGYLKAVEWLWRNLLSSEKYSASRPFFEKLSTISDWEAFDDLYGEAGHLVDGELGPYGEKETIRHGLDIEETKAFTAEEKAGVVLAEASKVPPTHPLDRIFEMRPVRVGASHPYAQDNYFTALFTGLLFWARDNNDKVKVLRIRHHDSAGNRFSYALFVPAFGTFASNASEYWLILDAATDFSGNGNQSRLMIEELIKNGGESVVVQDYYVPDLKELENYVRSRALKHLRARANDFEALLSDFRGAIAELLVAEMLRRERFEILGMRRNLRSLGGKEVDVIAIRRSTEAELLLVECKAHLGSPYDNPAEDYPGPRHDPSRDLTDALEFVKTVSSRTSDCSPIFQELEVQKTGKVITVVAVVGTVDSRAKKILLRLGCEVWDWDNLSQRFAKAGIIRRFWEPLERFASMDRRAESALDYEKDVLSDVDVSLNK